VYCTSDAFNVLTDEESVSSESGKALLRKVAELLQVISKNLAEAITTKVLVGAHTIVQPQSEAQAKEKRDALAKGMYACLFSWLVQCLNKTIAAPTHEVKWGFIGVLDIYGFEVFQT
jgi:myosin heavy subunit